jgi:hypothetical protein
MNASMKKQLRPIADVIREAGILPAGVQALAEVPASVTLRDEKAERVERTMAANLQAAQASALISTAVEPEVQSAHAERQADAKAAIAALVDEFHGDELDYVRQAIIESLCSRADFMAAAKHGQIGEACTELKVLLERQGVSEVDDERICRKTDWIGKLEVELEGWLDLLAAGRQAHRDETGSDWYPRKLDPDAKMKKLQTAARAGAAAILARHGVAAA